MTQLTQGTCRQCGQSMEYDDHWRVWFHHGEPFGFCPVTGGTIR